MPVSRSAAARQWRGDHRHAELYRRGALFGALRTYDEGGVSAQLLDAARATFESQRSSGSGESAAAIMLLGRAGALRAKVGDRWAPVSLDTLLKAHEERARAKSKTF